MIGTNFNEAVRRTRRCQTCGESYRTFELTACELEEKGFAIDKFVSSKAA